MAPLTSDRCRKVLTTSVVLVSLVSTILTVLHLSTPRRAILKFYTSKPRNQGICEMYSPVYTDAEKTHDYYIQRGGIQPSDLAASRDQCAGNGQCSQIKLSI